MDDEFQDFINAQKEVVVNSYEHARQYLNIIILGGYAGLFTIWSFTKSDLQTWQVLSVGLCILLSLLIYIFFELYGSWLRTTQVNNQMKELLEAEQLNRFPDEYGKSELKMDRRMVGKTSGRLVVDGFLCFPTFRIRLSLFS